METKTHPLGSVLKQVEDLKEYGHNSVLRRALNIITKELYLEKDRNREAQFNCRPDAGCRPDHICLNADALPFEAVLFEVNSDANRSSVILDPAEALIGHLLSFFSGKKDVLEIRVGSEPTSFLQAEDAAMNYIRANHLIPLVSVNMEMAQSKEQLVFALKDVLQKIESNEFNFSAAVQCRLSGFESLGTRFTNNGRSIESGRVEVFICRRPDSCCGNQTYTRYGATQWSVVWTDGNSTIPPPITPPDFTHVPWNNQLPLLPANVTGTQTSDWGWRNLNGQPNFHGGIDIAVPVDSRVLSINSGTVAKIFNSGHDSGVVITDGTRTYTYFHIKAGSGIREGMAVNPGDSLGRVVDGGPIHLHYAIHNPGNGDYRDRSDANSENPLP